MKGHLEIYHSILSPSRSRDRNYQNDQSCYYWIIIGLELIIEWKKTHTRKIKIQLSSAKK